MWGFRIKNARAGWACIGKYGLCWLLLVTLGLDLSAQPTRSQNRSPEEEYQRRIRKEFLYGVYIPSDLGDAFRRLNELIASEDRKKFAQRDEVEVARRLHFSLGRWIIYNWGFYQGSRLSHYLRERWGVSYPDDQARFIIVAYHRSLNQRPLDLDQLAEKFKAYRQRLREEELEKARVIYEEKVDSVPAGGGKP